MIAYFDKNTGFFGRVPKKLTFVDIFGIVVYVVNPVRERNINLEYSLRRSLLLPLSYQFLFHELKSSFLESNP